MLFQKKHKIGDTIAKLRKEKGWTQNELADWSAGEDGGQMSRSKI